MEKIIFTLLATMFTTVRKDALENLARGLSIQVTTEDDAKALVAKLTETQVKDFEKEFRARVDKEVSDSNKTFEQNLRKKYDLVEKKVETPPAVVPPTGEITMEGIAKMIAESMKSAVEPLAKEFAALKAGETTKSRQQTLSEKLAACKDEVFKAKILKDFSRMQFQTQEEFDEYLADTEKDIVTANQNSANAALAGGANPYKGKFDIEDGKEATEKEVEAVLEKLL